MARENDVLGKHEEDLDNLRCRLLAAVGAHDRHLEGRSVEKGLHVFGVLLYFGARDRLHGVAVVLKAESLAGGEGDGESIEKNLIKAV